jgi:hypothetical protein
MCSRSATPQLNTWDGLSRSINSFSKTHVLMSVLLRISYLSSTSRDFRFVPIPDSCAAANSVGYSITAATR